MKIADFTEPEIAFKAGADLVTVMGAVDDETIKVPWKQQKNTVRGSS
jgi:3-keto-L-gulonate-6-phosphate decarboxylase